MRSGELSSNIRTAFLIWVVAVVDRCLCVCPTGCTCIEGLVSCSQNTVSFIPGASQIPADTTTMVLSQNRFANPRLQPANFSGYHRLEEIRLKNCGIQSIDSYTFREAPSLIHLDLSQNELTTVAGGAFTGLSLDYLFLSDNPNLQLSPTFTTGMSAEVIDLGNCGLRDISPSTFAPMLGTLRKLFLHGNNLMGFPPGMLAVFASLDTLKLYDNPLSCDCNMKWLKDFYDQNKNTFRVSDLDALPTCAAPKRLQGRHFNNLLPTDFSCQKPTVTNLSVQIEATVTVLQCEAQGYPPPNITWHLPGGGNQFYQADLSADKTVGEVKVATTKLKAQGLYICVASNKVGNATSSVNLTQVIQENPRCDNSLTTTGSEVVIPANADPQPETDNQNELLFMKKYFSLVDLLSSILGTFFGTLIISVIILHFCVYRKNRKSHYSNSPSPMSDYSDSLKNDSSSRCVPNNTAHQMMLHVQHNASQCIQNRPLPNKPYARVYDEAHYMSPPLSERDDLDSNNIISPYGQLNTMGRVFCPMSVSPCEACRNQTEPHTTSSS